MENKISTNLKDATSSFESAKDVRPEDPGVLEALDAVKNLEQLSKSLRE